MEGAGARTVNCTLTLAHTTQQSIVHEQGPVLWYEQDPVLSTKAYHRYTRQPV